jgi:hypothetical protein
VNQSPTLTRVPRLVHALSLFWFFIAAITIDPSAQTADDRYPIVKNGKLGFIDSDGREVIAPEFFPIADMAYFKDGLAPVNGPRGAGYIDPTGRYVIGPQREWGQPRPFHEGTAAVLIWGKNGAFNTPAFIDQTGRVILSGPSVKEGSYFSDGLMPMQEHERWGFVNKRFRWVISPRYSYAQEFSEGRAPVRIGRQWGFIDKTGKLVVPARYDLVWGFSNGLARVRIAVPSLRNEIHDERDERDCRCLYGFVDTEGREVMRPRFIYATYFSEDRAFASTPAQLLAIIDKTGSTVSDPKYEMADEFSEGVAAARVNGTWGYVDRSGSWAIAPQFTHADGFWHGLARVVWEDGRGYIDKTGHTVWKSPKP